MILPRTFGMAYVRAWLLLLILAACTPALALQSDQAKPLSSERRSGNLPRSCFSPHTHGEEPGDLFFAVIYAGDLDKNSVQQAQCMLQTATLWELVIPMITKELQ